MINIRKKHQRKLNKEIRKLNQAIRNDDLWLGRFEFRQKNAWFYKFDDNSGGILTSKIRAVDKKTGYYKDFMVDYIINSIFICGELFKIANDFIVEDTGVWEENPNPIQIPKNMREDFRDIRINEDIMNKKDNFFLKYYKS